MLQAIVVALLVAGCSAYAAWTLMPAAARRALARRLLTLRLPAAFSARLQRAAQAASGCGCDGCDHAPAKKAVPAAPQAMTFHRRPPR